MLCDLPAIPSRGYAPDGLARLSGAPACGGALPKSGRVWILGPDFVLAKSIWVVQRMRRGSYPPLHGISAWILFLYRNNIPWSGS